MSIFKKKIKVEQTNSNIKVNNTAIDFISEFTKLTNITNNQSLTINAQKNQIKELQKEIDRLNSILNQIKGTIG